MEDSDSDFDDMNGSIKSSAHMTQHELAPPAPWAPEIVRDSQIPVSNTVEFDMHYDEDELFGNSEDLLPAVIAAKEKEPYAVDVALQEYQNFMKGKSYSIQLYVMLFKKRVLLRGEVA